MRLLSILIVSLPIAAIAQTHQLGLTLGRLSGPSRSAREW